MQRRIALESTVQEGDMRHVGPGLTVVLMLAVGVTQAGERSSRLEVPWGRSIPEVDADRGPNADPPKPLLVLIVREKNTRDQERFEEVVMKNESFLLAAKFFRCVEVWEETARKHALFEDIKFRAPAAVAFDSTRKKHAVAGGRASAMKIYGILCKIGQPDYETSIAGTVRAARNLLGKFDQVDAARDSLGIKRQRLDEAMVKGNQGKIATLKRECAKDQKAIDKLYAAAQDRWREIWQLKRKKRDEPKDKDKGKDGDKGGDKDEKPNGDKDEKPNGGKK
jgi:hypothetical protein